MLLLLGLDFHHPSRTLHHRNSGDHFPAYLCKVRVYHAYMQLTKNLAQNRCTKGRKGAATFVTLALRYVDPSTTLTKAVCNSLA
jgi:hypothetical protein